MFAAAIVRAYMDHARHTLGKDAFQKTQYILDDLNRHLGEARIGDLNGQHLLAWIAAHPEWTSDWTRKRSLGIAKRPFNWAADLGMIKISPFGRISWASGKRGQPMPKEAFRSLLRHSVPPFRRALLFLRYTGCRPGELLQLTWDHYDQDRHCFVLHQHKTSRKTGRPRVIVLNRILVKMIAWMKARRCGNHVFPYKRRNLYMRLADVRRKAQIPQSYRLYGLRHAFGTEGVKRGVNLKILSECMGHSSVETTEYYVHLAKDTSTLRNAINSMF